MRNALWPRRRFLAVAGIGGAAAALVGCGSSDDASTGPAAPPASKWGGELVEPGLAKPDVTLATTDGKPFPFRTATEGQLTLLFFGFTNCPDQCPIWLSAVARAKEQIGSGPGSDPQVLFVGVDVARDTPEVLDEYLERIDPSFIGLTGTESAIAAANRQLYFPSITIGAPDAGGDYEVGHYGRAAAFSPDNLAHRLYGFDVRPADLARDLPRLANGIYE
ncbi:MAG: SCO family protein [Acidimicrobiales bacterium]|jgi:protein SCO1/2